MERSLDQRAQPCELTAAIVPGGRKIDDEIGEAGIIGHRVRRGWLVETGQEFRRHRRPDDDRFRRRRSATRQERRERQETKRKTTRARHGQSPV